MNISHTNIDCVELDDGVRALARTYPRWNIAIAVIDVLYAAFLHATWFTNNWSNAILVALFAFSAAMMMRDASRFPGYVRRALLLDCGPNHSCRTATDDDDHMIALLHRVKPRVWEGVSMALLGCLLLAQANAGVWLLPTIILGCFFVGLGTWTSVSSFMARRRNRERVRAAAAKRSV